MRVHVLGSAADGGFPHCNCRNCAGLPQGAIRFTAVRRGARPRFIRPTAMPRIAGILSGFGSKTSIPRRTFFFYAPGLRYIEPHLRRYLEDADLLLVDGMVWNRRRAGASGVSERRAREMGHLPLSGDVPEGLMRRRKILIHANNTNPILDEESPERRLANQKG